MRYKTHTQHFTFTALFGAFILLVGTAGCRTSRQTTSASPPLVASHHTETIQQPPLDATQTCRATLHRIEGAMRLWALENRQLNSAMPTDADLFGPGRYLPEKPKCPSGGTYTLRAVEDAPRCSVPGHVY